MALNFAQIMDSAGIDPATALVIRHAYVREREDGTVGIHSDSSVAEIMADTRVQSANTRADVVRRDPYGQDAQRVVAELVRSEHRHAGDLKDSLKDGQDQPGVITRDPHGELPVACTLGPNDGVKRMRRWQELADANNPIASRDRGTLEVRFEPGVGVLDELASLAAAEQQCCSFVTWAVTEDNGRPLLRVLAKPESPDDIAPIAALFGAS